MDAELAQLVTSLIVGVTFIHLVLGGCAYLILLERKVCAWMQDRIGPNRVGFDFGVLPFKHHAFGLGQPLADGIKLLAKEDYTPSGVDRALFILAPVLAVVPALIGWAVIPFGGHLQWGANVVNVAAANINVGVIYILAVGSTAVYGVTLAGYSSNNKYAFLGGLRATAQMLSYEIPMGLCLLVILLQTGSGRADMIVHAQANGVWNLVYQPMLAAVFFTCSLAECNRAPFDLAESEQELVGGFHTEYASMKWALFFMGEYAHMITGCAFFTLLFLGGWDLPLIQEPLVGGLGWVALKSLVFLGKTTFMVFVMMWVRWTLPRLRWDQLMRLAWRHLIPLTLAMLLVSALVVHARAPMVKGERVAHWDLMVANLAVCAVALVVYPLLPKGPNSNRKIALAGSRFSPA